MSKNISSFWSARSITFILWDLLVIDRVFNRHIFKSCIIGFPLNVYFPQVPYLPADWSVRHLAYSCLTIIYWSYRKNVVHIDFSFFLIREFLRTLWSFVDIIHCTIYLFWVLTNLKFERKVEVVKPDLLNGERIENHFQFNWKQIKFKKFWVQLCIYF